MSRDQETLDTALVHLVRRALLLLASPKTAVVLLLALATVLASATLLEASHGSAYARWFVYESAWFFGLLALLGIHVFCAAASRYPWKRHQIGFVVTHAGLLLLLVGAAWSSWGGARGQISLAESESADHILLPNGSRISAFWVGRPQEPSLEFTFEGGPVDWPPGKSLEIGEVDGVKARILAYYPQATATETWIADESSRGGPAVQFVASGPAGVRVAEGWLVDQQFGDAVAVGPIRLQLQQAVSDRMLEDFLAPPVDDFGKQGRLTMYFGDTVKRVAVDQSVGQRIPLGTSGVEVEIVAYLPNAVPDRLGNFTTKGEQPKHPMLELRVHLPGEERPLRQIAFAKDPLLNLDGVYPRLCPVKFRFEHAAVQPQTAVELLQAGDGKLLGRLCSAGQRESPRELHPGDAFDLPGQFRVQIGKHIPHAKRKVTYEASTSTSRKTRDESQPAALLELTVGGKTEQVWLRRGDPTYGRSTLAMPGGVLALSYEAARVPLGFALTLDEIRRDPNSASAGSAAQSSIVRVLDSQNGVDQQHVVSVNRRFTYRGFSIHQSRTDDATHQRNVSNLLVTRDPGRALKYGGGLAICAGLAIMFAMRTYVLTCRGGVLRPSALLAGHAATNEQRSQQLQRRAA